MEKEETQLVIDELVKEKERFKNVIDNQNILLNIMVDVSDRLEGLLHEKDNNLFVIISLLMGMNGKNYIGQDELLENCNEIINLIINHFSGDPMPEKLINHVENGQQIVDKILNSEQDDKNITFIFKADKIQ